MRAWNTIIICSLIGVLGISAARAELRGDYVEARTCQVYTGPCFAAGEVGTQGKDAVLAWNIHEGTYQGVDLAGLNVVLMARADATLGFAGFDNATSVRSTIIVDERASEAQRSALVEFARTQAGKGAEEVVSVRALPCSFQLDKTNVTAELEVGDVVRLATRRARPTDCICSNEVAYYPPLIQPLDGFAAGVAIEGSVTVRELGSRWSIPNSRSAYMGTFSVSQ